MRYGICHLSIVPMRAEPSDRSELVNQVLYGEHFKVVELRKEWSKIKLSHDKYEGWIDNKQYVEITEDQYAFAKAKPLKLSTDPVQFITTVHDELLTIVLGSSVENIDLLNASFEGSCQNGTNEKQNLIQTSLLYMKSPYLWGGRTTFGIDCSGFTQMVYRLNGYFLKRDASQQASQGEALSFIEESEPGDLAFFDNADGIITHVGIIMEDNHIIHAHGEVRIDRLDHSGIYNPHTRSHTHKLRVIKKII